MRHNPSYRLKGLALTAFILAGLMAAPGSWSCQSSEKQTLSIGMIADITNTLIYIADEQRLFAANGLDVTLKAYDTGSAAAEAMVKGEVDLAGATEFVVVEKALQKQAISVIASRDKFESIYLVGRKDRGIGSISDLKGKMVGLPVQSINEFYLSRFLDRQGLNLRDVRLVNVPPAQSVDAFTSGKVDAVVIRQSLADQIAQPQPDGVAIWSVQSDQLAFAVLAGRKDWIAQHPEGVRRFLRSLAQAEEYLAGRPAEAKAIVQKRLNFDDAQVESLWPHHQFSLTIDLSLITAMTDEARWMIRNNLTTEKTVPDFLDYIYEDGLKAVKPGAVNIIR